MADKMLKIAGRSDAGLAKAIRTNENGNVGVVLSDSVTEEDLNNPVTLEKGTGTNYEIDMSDHVAYRVLISPWEGTGYDTPISVRQLSAHDWGGFAENITYNKPILESKGNGVMVVGNSSGVVSNAGRSMWSDIVIPLRKTQKMRIYHPNDSPYETASFKVTVVKYKNVANAPNESNTATAKETIMEFRRSTSISPLTSFPDVDDEDNLTFDYPVQIDLLEWQTNHRTMPGIYIEVKKNGEWTPLTRIIERDFSSSYGHHTPQYIQELKSGMWEILEFDTTWDKMYFKFSLRKPITASEGLRIYIHNNSDSTSYSGGVVVQGRRL